MHIVNWIKTSRLNEFNSGCCYGVSYQKKRLLIVDDSELIRDRLVDMFDDIENFDPFLQARNSDQAYSVFNAILPDIVVLDIHIPGDNGFKILEKLKKVTARCTDNNVYKLSVCAIPQKMHGTWCRLFL